VCLNLLKRSLTCRALESIGRYFWSSCDVLECGNSILALCDASDSANEEAENCVCVSDVTLDELNNQTVRFQSDCCYVLKCFGFAVCVIGCESSYPCREAAKNFTNNLVLQNKCVNSTVLNGLHYVQHPLVMLCLPAQHTRPPKGLLPFPFYRTNIICRVTKNVTVRALTSSSPHVPSASANMGLHELMNSPVKPISPVAPVLSQVSSSCLLDDPIAARIAKIWIFDGHSTVSLSTSEYGVFEVNHMYIIQVIRSSYAKRGVCLHRLYFWIGPNLQQRVLALAKIISVSNSVSKYVMKGGNNCSEIEIFVLENFSLTSHMCHKPKCLESSLSRQNGGFSDNPEFRQQRFANDDALIEFAALFNKGIFVVDKFDHPTYGLSMPSVALGYISGKSVSSTICTLMKRELSSLHSLGNFCIIAPTCVLIWYGRWSDSVSRKVSFDFVRTHFRNRLVRAFDQGNEPQEFFSYLEQSNIVDVHKKTMSSFVRSPEYLLTAPWWIPRLFACELETGSLITKPCASLEQRFFVLSSCMIVDAWTFVFVWISSCASKTLVTQCTSIAQEFVIRCPDRSVCNVVLEHQYSESDLFRDLFVVWRNWQKVVFYNFEHYSQMYLLTVTVANV
jgi:hypothetical protein